MNAPDSAVVVTGARGFLGAYLVRELAAQFPRVIAIDKRPAQPGPAERARVEHLTQALPCAEFEALLRSAKPGLLVHAAGPSSVPASLSDPAADFRDSPALFFAVLDAVRRCAPECRVIFLSSAAVYGQPKRLPVREDAPPGPVSPYGFHKLLCERLADQFARLYGLRVCSVRIFSAYGEGLRRQVIWDICRMALEQPQVRLFGTGDETRDFIHGQDVARAIALLSRKAGWQADVYNLASGADSSIRGLAQSLLAALGCAKPVIFSGQGRPGDPLRWRADVRRLRELGFAPAITLEQGVARYVKWIVSERGQG
jgi:UDP-glucose 4-epimerase